MLAQAITEVVTAEAPLFSQDEDRKKTAGLLVAMAFRESSLRADAVGDKVAGKPTSFCAFQIHLPWDHKTAEGWTGQELLEDPHKCVLTAMHMIRISMRVCPDHPLAWYAEGPPGCGSARAQRISKDRVSIGKYLVRTVPEPREKKDEEKTASAAPAGVAITSRRSTDEP